MPDLFVEVFPVNPEALPELSAYTVTLAGDVTPGQVQRLGNRLAGLMRRAFGRHWLWSSDVLVTDSTEHNDIEVPITVDGLLANQPERFSGVVGAAAQAEAVTDPSIQADYVVRGPLRDLRDPMQQALAAFDERIKGAHVQRETRAQPWAVNGEPAVSISIASRLLYHQTAQEYVGGLSAPDGVSERLVGLWAWHEGDAVRGEIIGVLGRAGDERPRLLKEPPLPHLSHDLLLDAPDDTWLLTVRAGKRELLFRADELRLIVRLKHLHAFDVDPRQAVRTLQMQPATRAKQMRAVSDVPKESGLLLSAYNSRTHPGRFFSADFEMNLRFDRNRVRPYGSERLSDDFLKCGVYRMRATFDNGTPVRVSVVNALNMKLEDFIEAMRRHLQRYFPLQIEIARERRVRVLNENTLANAVRVVGKEEPDIILAFFADESREGEDEDTEGDANADFIKSLTLGRGIPTHLIYQSTLDDPDAMTAIIMSILGKTGNAPFVLAEPVENADAVVGLDIVRQYVKTSEETRLTAVARVYEADGTFLSYRVREMTLSGDHRVPYALIRDLFPQREYSGKRVILHHAGALDDDLLAGLSGWAKAIGVAFYPVEIIRTGAPRIYALGEKGVGQPPWGSAFQLSDTEAILVSSLPREDVTPQPLHIRTVPAGSPPLPIAEALRGVLVWSLLAYNTERLPKLPVTVLNTDQLAYWLARGNKLTEGDGEVPFWL